MDTETMKWMGVFMPFALREMQRVRERQIKFVHYCSAESGLAILRSKSMWLRNSKLMNDFSEVDYGANCLRQAYQSAAGDRLKRALADVQVDLPSVIEANHDDLFHDIRNETYLISISEHADCRENDFGRLSMWRAYAPRNGVAFVFNNTPFLCESDALKAYSSPVAYATPDEFVALFEEMVAGVEANLDELKKLGGQFLHDFIMLAFIFAVQSTKHPSFAEEREWRVLYTPTILVRRGEMTDQQLQRIPTQIACIKGVPQRIYEIPFSNYPEEGFVGATAPE
ncbi:MAG TPA: DUF2971 domain-containing protein, partial [Sphingomicrobium sp.]|nr:DUF2971 domain-containing protein [Sphingomicrobium sp.]